MTIITKKRLIAAGVLSALIAGNMAMAADVPAGVQLAEKQTLVRNSGAEPQSLDPNKIEGVPEANISRPVRRFAEYFAERWPPDPRRGGELG